MDDKKTRMLSLLNGNLDKINSQIIERGVTQELLADKLSLEFQRDVLLMNEDFTGV